MNSPARADGTFARGGQIRKCYCEKFELRPGIRGQHYAHTLDKRNQPRNAGEEKKTTAVAIVRKVKVRN